MKNWERVTELLAAALERAPGERAAWLEQEESDGVVREQVMKLLAAYEEEPDFLDWELGELEKVGPWRVLREIGQGGMGKVYEAVHEDVSLGRRVALKVVGGTRLFPALVESFLAERAMLARLEHPRIARLYDSGATEQGWPYFAMEFVEGVTLEQWQRDRQPREREWVELLLGVVDAVSYAHGKFIAHGDLKPGNLLVTAAGEARVVDFGIGRMWTEAQRGALPLLTPGHASPEQMQGEAITAASDIYQLGKLLERGVRSEELRAVVKRATAAEPAGRYASAAALAEDLRAWLERRPVSAVEGGWGYGLKKFVERRPLVAGLAVAVALGVVGTGWQAVRAERNRARAEHQFEEARRFSRGLLAQIPELPVMAQKSIVQSTVQLLESYGAGVEDDPVVLLELAYAWKSLGNVQGLPTAKNLGDADSAARSFGQALALTERARKLGSPGTERMQISLYGNLARVAVVRKQPEETRQWRGKLEQALREWKGTAKDEDVAAGYSELAFLVSREDLKQGKELYARAVGLFPGDSVQKAYALKRWGGIELRQKHYAEGVALYERALEVEERLKVDGMDTSFTLSDLGLGYRKLKRFPQALASYERARQLREAAHRDDPNDVRVLNALGQVYWRMGWTQVDAGAPEAAVELGRKSVDYFGRAVRVAGEDEYNLTGLASGKVYLAEFLILAEQQRGGGKRSLKQLARELPEARKLLEEALAVERRYPSAEVGDELKALGYLP